jgi:hypothetical protein
MDVCHQMLTIATGKEMTLTLTIAKELRRYFGP